MNTRSLLAALVTVVAVVLILLLAFVITVRRQKVDPVFEKFESQFSELGPAFLQDQEWYHGLDLFPAPTGPDDAGPFLNPRVAWDTNTDAEARWREDQDQTPELLVLPEETKEAVRALEKNWMQASEELWGPLDFGWMSQLQQYGHWDSEMDSPTQAHGGDLFTAPIPNFVDLMHWSKLRLVKGIAQGDPIAAANEVRHLARLCHSTELLIGGAIAVALLGHEDSARVSLGEEAPPEWSTIDEEGRDRLKRMLFAAAAYTNLAAPQEAFEAFDPGWFGACAGLNESYASAMMLRPALEDRRAERYAQMDTLLPTVDGCRLSLVRRRWGSDEPTPSLAELECPDDTGVGCTLFQAAPFFPGAHSLVGDILLAISVPGWWSKYEDEATPHEG